MAVERRTNEGSGEKPVIHAVSGEPFTVSPVIDLKSAGGETLGNEIPLYRAVLEINGENKGSVIITGGRRNREGNPPLLFPFGKPSFEIEIDRRTGLYLVKSIPLSVSFEIRKVSGEDANGISVAWQTHEGVLQGSCQHTFYGYGFQDSPGIARYERWINPDTGNASAVYIPSQGHQQTFASSPFVITLP